MKHLTSGFMMIDALLCFLIASLIVTLLARSLISLHTQALLIQKNEQVLEEREVEWWQESNGGCRDTCLIDALVYPWN